MKKETALQQFFRKEFKSESLDTLKKILKPKDKIYTILKSISKSGMSRKIKLLVSNKNEIKDITWDVSQILGMRMNNGAIIVSGTGMDMGLLIVSRLSRVLFQESYALKQSWL